MNTVLRIYYDFCRPKLGMNITNTNQWTSTVSLCQFPVKSHDTLTYFPLLPFTTLMLCTAHSTMDDMKYLLALEEETYLLLATALILEKPEQLPDMCQILS